MARLHLVRHGETTSNVMRCLDTALPGVALTDFGVRQGFRFALENQRSDGPVLLTSVARRAAQTAELIGSVWGVDADAVEWLHEHWTRYAKACALCATELADAAYVLAPEPGGLTPWHPSNATRAFGRLRDKLELPTWVHLHGLRHLQVTQLLDAGIPLRHPCLLYTSPSPRDS